jgi:hypothetical protein
MWIECKDCIVGFLCERGGDGLCGVNDEEMDKILFEVTSIKKNGEQILVGMAIGTIKAVAEMKNWGHLSKETEHFIKSDPYYEAEFKLALEALRIKAIETNNE